MDRIDAWLEFLKTVLQLSTGAILGSGLFAIIYIAISYFGLGVFPLEFPLFVVAGLGLILGEGFSQIINKWQNNPNRRYLEQEKLVIRKLQTLDAAEKSGLISLSEKKAIGGELIKNLVRGKSIDNLDISSLSSQDSTPQLEDQREEE